MDLDQGGGEDIDSAVSSQRFFCSAVTFYDILHFRETH